jgi:hypothetical protein
MPANIEKRALKDDRRYLANIVQSLIDDATQQEALRRQQEALSWPTSIQQIYQSSIFSNSADPFVGIPRLNRFHIQQNLLRRVLRGVNGSPSARAVLNLNINIFHFSPFTLDSSAHPERDSAEQSAVRMSILILLAHRQSGNNFE